MFVGFCPYSQSDCADLQKGMIPDDREKFYIRRVDIPSPFSFSINSLQQSSTSSPTNQQTPSSIFTSHHLSAQSTMKFSLLSLAVLLSAGVASALPHAWAGEGEGEGKGKHHGPPGPPSGSYESASQSCSASQSSIHCCNQGGSGPRNHKVGYIGSTYDMQCSQVGGKFSPVHFAAFALSTHNFSQLVRFRRLEQARPKHLLDNRRLLPRYWLYRHRVLSDQNDK